MGSVVLARCTSAPLREVTTNRIATRVIAKLLDGPAAMRSWLIDRYVVEDFSFEEVMRDDDKLEALSARRRLTSGMPPAPVA
jgi:hypothetical protein